MFSLQKTKRSHHNFQISCTHSYGRSDFQSLHPRKFVRSQNKICFSFLCYHFWNEQGNETSLLEVRVPSANSPQVSEIAVLLSRD